MTDQTEPGPDPFPEDTTGTNREISGEARLRRRRRSFWRYLAVAFVASILVGAFSGALVDVYENGSIPLWLPVAIMVLAVTVFAWFTRDYFKRVDELDLMDNLWAHLTGVYGGMIVFAVWYFTAELDLVAYPNAPAMMAIIVLIVFAAYGLRKLGWR
ncbi:hypothetical protein AAG612_02940 [Citromicrobium bathyomarinum]|uniref:hypothetical protein n=1 Tax=Citromicrobium bathyomarinum TaxID=72174 RepID=UPI003159BB57